MRPNWQETVEFIALLVFIAFMAVLFSVVGSGAR